MVAQQADGAVDSTNRSTDTTTAGTHRRNQLVSNVIQFIQLNLQHCQSASALLIKQITRLNMAVVAIQEPWTNKGRILGQNSKGCSNFHGCGNNSRRTCIVTKGVYAMYLLQFSDRDITGWTPGSSPVLTATFLSYKCTKHQFIHLLTATFKDLHIENSKNYKRW